ncbi:MAG: hypothetical protein LBL27_00985 [Coriobacteriales bacterium]|jgi:hypothetical protein|nr:hypothetical protein [Coriobacteriales bacterium]
MPTQVTGQSTEPVQATAQTIVPEQAQAAMSSAPTALADVSPVMGSAITVPDATGIAMPEIEEPAALDEPTVQPAVQPAAQQSAPAPAPASTPASTLGPAVASAESAADESLANAQLPVKVLQKNTKRSAGARMLALVFKIIAVLFWVAAVLMILVSAVDIFGGGGGNYDWMNIFDRLVENGALIVILGGFILGLIFFGIGEVIGLLNDIRKNTR